MLLVAWQAFAQSPQCFYQTAVNNFAISYFGNDRTHDNTAQPRATETASGLVAFGRNGFILDGPVFYVGTECTTSSLIFDVYKVDQYKQHCICTSGSAIGQGCTTISSGVVSIGSCPGGTGELIDNTYDVGLYCVGGSCNFGQLYAHVGPIDVVTNPMMAGINKFPWKEGPNTLLPVGSYAIGMGTNCDSGSIAGQTGMVTTSGGNNVVSWAFGPYFDTTGSWNGTSIYIGNPTHAYTIGSVSSQTSLTVTRNINKMTNVAYVQGSKAGLGDGNCAQGRGEGSSYGAGSSGSGWKGATQLMSFKDFVTRLDAQNKTPAYHADCLLYDINHDNTSGLPSSLNVYSGGSIGCKYVNDSSTGINPLSPAGQAPHMIDFAIW